MFAHFNPICYEGADYVEQYPHQEWPDKHIVSQETVKVPLSFNYCLLALLRVLDFQKPIALLFLLYMYVTKTFPTLNANLLCVNFVLCMELFVRGCDAPKQQGVVYSTSDTDTQRICIGCILQNPECQTHHWVWSPVLVYWIRILSFKA